MSEDNRLYIGGCDFTDYRTSSIFDSGETYCQQENFINKLKKLAATYGKDVSLSAMIRIIQPMGHKCPKCNGKGTYQVEYNAGDLGWYEPAYRDVQCELCHGKGWTEEEYVKKFKTIEDGYEVKK